MEPFNNTTTTAENTGLSPVGFDVFSPLSNFVGDNLILGKVLGFLNTIWMVYVLLAFLFVVGMLLLFTYASSQKRQLTNLQKEIIKNRERIYDEKFRSGPKNNRLNDIEKHIVSDSPNDWKLAIIEADIVLDEALKKAGFGGVSLGERLRSVGPSQLVYLDDAWQAHKVRNQIAHGSADFVLTRRLAEDTIKQYKRVFAELGIS